jgi:hypothetical protein
MSKAKTVTVMRYNRRTHAVDFFTEPNLRFALRSAMFSKFRTIPVFVFARIYEAMRIDGEYDGILSRYSFTVVEA